MRFVAHRNWLVIYAAPHGAPDAILSSLVDQLGDHDNAILRYVFSESGEGPNKQVCALLRLGKKLTLPEGMLQLRLEGLSTVASPCYEVVDALKFLCAEGVKLSNFDMTQFIIRQAQADGLFFDLTVPSGYVSVSPVVTRRRRRTDNATPGAPKKVSRHL